MNVSALKQVTREWPRVVATVGRVREAYVRRRRLDRLTLFEFTRLAFAGLMLPAYLIFRTPNRAVGGRVPVFVAALHKMFAGLFSVGKNLLVCRAAAGDRYDQLPADPAELSDFAERSGMLVGITGTEVCAGPPNLIDEVLRLLATGASETEPDSGPVAALLPDPDTLLGYTEAAADVTLWVIVLGLRARESVVALFAGLQHVRALRPETERWVVPLVPGLSDFAARGFGADRLPALRDLGLAGGEAMIQGLVPLFTHLRGDDTRGPLFAPSEVGESGLRLASWLRGTDRGRDCDQAGLEMLGGAFARCLRMENDGIATFRRVQAAVHQALGYQPPDPAVEGATLASLFGALPSTCFAEAFGVGVRQTAGGSLLMDRGRQLSFV
jgi:hypothetical protein